MLGLPILLNLHQQPCLLVGGGRVALRKARLLAEAGAVVSVMAPDIEPELETLLVRSHGRWLAQSYLPDFSLKPYRLIIAATNNPEVNAMVFTQAEQQGVLVNSVDDLPHCRFTLPAIIDRSPIQIAISTGGASPVLARQLRTQLEGLIPHHYGALAEFSGQWRERVKQQFPNPDTRRPFWEAFYASPLAEKILQGEMLSSEAFEQFLQGWQQPQGEVYLVGAGPGDPDLLTFKALRLMQQADIIVYDRLVSDPIMALVRRDAERVYVGKQRANHALPQESINRLLVRLAQEGKRVCRLKGGDPFIFGRGGEEIETLVEAGVRFQVVPGITAAAGCGAYAGIPLTHRDYAQSVRFLTGHLKEGSPELPWKELVYEQQTLVLYMGLTGLDQIMRQLRAHGIRPEMPVALISRGTTPEQRVVVGTVEDIAAKAARHDIAAPTITIIGEVVQLREKLKWREDGD